MIQFILLSVIGSHMQLNKKKNTTKKHVLPNYKPSVTSLNIYKFTHTYVSLQLCQKALVTY